MNNWEQEEKLKAYQNMLNSGQIDEATYINMVNRNIGPIEKYGKPKKNFKPLIVAVLVCVIVFTIFKFLGQGVGVPKIEKEYEYVNSYDAIDAPLQSDYTGSTTMIVRNTVINVEYKAYYEVSGRVVAKRDYLSNSVSNDASRTDVSLVWGKLATKDYLDHIDWNAPGDRFIYWKTNDMEWYRRNTNDKEITALYSNNHLVTNDTKLLKMIRNIDTGDYVRIKGYLVNLYWNENGDRYWKSSTVRTDDGDGACEVIYVTDVKWLKEA